MAAVMVAEAVETTAVLTVKMAAVLTVKTAAAVMTLRGNSGA
jgi:hypothetical protein